MRFTLDGSDELESRIAADMARIRAAVLESVGEDALTALILGGGYGRGEGGVFLVDGQEQVYNDYDFFVVVPYSSRRRRNALSAGLNKVKAAMEPHCGIHVDFGPPVPRSQLGTQPYELMFMELQAGYHVVYGPENILDEMPDYDTQRPPLEECARLFMNRGVGLHLAETVLSERGVSDREDYEFVIRNIYKGLMAAGDSVLFVTENYSPSYVARRDRLTEADLSEVPDGDRLREAFLASIEFKLHPQHDVPANKSIEEWHREVKALFGQLFLWHERHRLKQPRMTWSDYMELPKRLPQLSSQQMPINIYRNLRTRIDGLPTLNELTLHPRDRILKRLPHVLFGEAPAAQDDPLMMHLWNYYG